MRTVHPRALSLFAGLALAPAALGQISQNFDGAAPGLLPSGWSTSGQGAGLPWGADGTQAYSAPYAAYTNDPPSISSQYLTFPSGTATGPITLDLYSSYTTENTFDGWTVEVSVNGGVYTNIGDSAWTVGGYNATISNAYQSPIGGQRAFSGASGWGQHTATIPAGAGDQIAIRINMSCDRSVASTGVWIDDVTVTNLTPAPMGACCLPDGSCVVVGSAACAASSGVYRGNNALCAAANCPVPPFQNGSFEAGTFFPGWAQFGNTAFSAVDDLDFGVVPQDGVYCAHFGPVDNTGGIRQIIGAHAGDQATIDFWYMVEPGEEIANSFSADFDGQNLVAFTNDTVNLAWTHFHFVRTVAGTNPYLSFTFRNDPSYFYLDNVTVTVVTGAPACYANCDHSTAVPFLNVQDFGCFLAKFAGGDAYANCDHSTQAPTLNVQDFNCFLAKFATGCSAP